MFYQTRLVRPDTNTPFVDSSLLAVLENHWQIRVNHPTFEKAWYVLSQDGLTMTRVTEFRTTGDRFALLGALDTVGAVAALEQAIINYANTSNVEFFHGEIVESVPLGAVEMDPAKTLVQNGMFV